MSIKTLYFFRHGQTDWNREGRVQGPGNDIPLNDIRRTQARNFALALRDMGMEHIFSSDLSRACDTAQVVANELGGAIV